MLTDDEINEIGFTLEGAGLSHSEIDVYLEHIGVKGMKWGQRRAIKKAYKRGETSRAQEEAYNKDTRRKLLIAAGTVGVVVVGGILAKKGGVKLLKSGFTPRPIPSGVLSTPLSAVPKTSSKVAQAMNAVRVADANAAMARQQARNFRPKMPKIKEQPGQGFPGFKPIREEPGQGFPDFKAPKEPKAPKKSKRRKKDNWDRTFTKEELADYERIFRSMNESRSSGGGNISVY